uniref:ATP-binding protein n=1 Tax=Nocardia suismassiliense TaxID=2077092 RepID=UPI003F498DE0
MTTFDHSGGADPDFADLLDSDFGDEAPIEHDMDGASWGQEPSAVTGRPHGPAPSSHDVVFAADDTEWDEADWQRFVGADRPALSTGSAVFGDPAGGTFGNPIDDVPMTVALGKEPAAPTRRVKARRPQRQHSRDYGSKKDRAARARDRDREERRLGKQAARNKKLLQLKLRGTVGHLTRTGSTTTAWFVQAPGAWTMRSSQKQNGYITSEAQVLSRLHNLGVERLHRRTVRASWPVGEWARNHDMWASPSADIPGTLSWSDYLVGQQAALMATGPTLKYRYWGIELPPRSAIASAVDKISSLTDNTPLAKSWPAKQLARWADDIFDREVTELNDLLKELGRALSSDGVYAHPATPREIDYLLRRSVSIGLPLHPAGIGAYSGQGEWESSDIAALVDAADIEVTPGDGYTTVSGVVDGRSVSSAVIVVTIGRMGELDIPDSMLPWQVIGDGLGIALEWSERIHLWSKERTRRQLKFQLDRIEAQYRHYTDEHDETPPLELRDQHARGRSILSEIDQDHTGLANRIEGWWRFAVVGATPEEARNRVSYLRDLYEPQIQLEVEDGQFQLLREFIPGEPQANVAHRRRMSVMSASSGMAAVSDRIGDRTGMLLGRTASIESRPFALDLWAGPERKHRSGFTPFVAVPGSGKSDLAGMIIYQSVRAGAYGVVLDPSGPMAKLATIPELAPYTRVYELTRNAKPGLLNIYRIIRDPRPTDAAYDPALPEFTTAPDPRAAARAQYEADLRAAPATRIAEVVTALTGMLPDDLRRDQVARSVIRRATTKVGGDRDHHLGEVLDAIDVLAQEATEPEDRKKARAVHDVLTMMRNLPEARVLFPAPGDLGGFDETGDERLTILTLPGLQLAPPDGSEDLDLRARMAGPLLHIAAWQVSRLIYDRPPRERKLAVIDEDKYIDATGIGRTLNLRLAIDSRKYNARVLVCSQTCDPFLSVMDTDSGDDKSSLANEVIIGDLAGDENAIAKALKLLKLPANEGYESLLAELGGGGEDTYDEDAPTNRRDDYPRRFVVKAADDREIICADWGVFAHLAHVRRALNSSPTEWGSR